MSPRPLSDALARAAGVERLLVAVDFDGTLAPIVDRPNVARALPGAVEVLVELAGIEGTAVAVVSGRTRADLAEHLGAQAASLLHLVGSHGAEVDDADPLPDAPTSAARDALVGTVRDLVGRVPGVLLEEKPGGVAVHVRMADRLDADQVLETLRHGPAAASGVHTLEGSEVLELSVLDTSKGSAVALLRDRTGAEAVLFAGDDITDETVLARLRDGDVGIKVGPGPSAAPYRLDAPQDVLDLLRTLLHARGGSDRAVR